MKSIYKVKKLYEEHIAQKRCGHDISQCENSFCLCSRFAEVEAYRTVVIPGGYERLNIFNFQGLSRSRKRLLSNQVVLEAKNKLCLYCWAKSWGDIISEYSTKEEQKIFMINHSVLPQRLLDSNNIVIYGDANKPAGRTLSASIVMNEAIRLRLKPDFRSHTYDWVDYCVLFNELKSDSPTGDADYFRGCDWLVIDNITISDCISYKQQHFHTDVLNPFLLNRMSDRLVTILVIKDNIDKTDNAEEKFGLGINSIISNKDTFIVPLC